MQPLVGLNSCVMHSTKRERKKKVHVALLNCSISLPWQLQSAAPFFLLATTKTKSDCKHKHTNTKHCGHVQRNEKQLRTSTFVAWSVSAKHVASVTSLLLAIDRMRRFCGVCIVCACVRVRVCTNTPASDTHIHTYTHTHIHTYI